MMWSQKVWIKFLPLLIIQIKFIAMEPAWYESYDGSRFLIDADEKYNWYQAWNECARYDAELVAIDTEIKNHVVMKILTKINEKNNNYWIGGNVFYEKISFRWSVNEQNFTFTNWATEDINAYAAQKQCVYLMRRRKNFPWYVDNCYDKSFGFICEEIIATDEVEDAGSDRIIKNLKGPIYNGSIYSLIG